MAGALVVKLERVCSGDLQETERWFQAGFAALGLSWPTASSRRAVSIEAKQGLPVVWNKTVKLKLTKDDMCLMHLPIHISIVGQPFESTDHTVATAQLPINPYLWQSGPHSDTVHFITADSRPCFELAVTCCLAPAEGCRDMYSKSSSATHRQVRSHASAPGGSAPQRAVVPRHRRMGSGSKPPLPYKSREGPELTAPTSAFASLALLAQAEQQGVMSNLNLARSSSVDDPDMGGAFGRSMRELKSQFLRETVSDLTYTKIDE